jgi:hypothetical protein
MNTGKQFTSHDSLLAIGVSLAMAGLILRGFAANTRRDLARRKQHRLDERRPDAADSAGQLAHPPTWLEKNLGLLANLVLVAGLVITDLGFWRK